MTIPAYAFDVPGGPGATPLQQAQALKDEGRLKVQPAHLLLIIMPDAHGPPEADGKVTTSQHLLQYVLVPSALFASDVKRGGVHWALSVARCAQWLQDLDGAGLDKTPIRGPAAKAAPILMRRVLTTAAKLPPHKRLVEARDLVWESTSLEDPQTGSF